MIIEEVTIGPGGGKTAFLAQRVTEAQDAGRDLCVVVVPDENQVTQWFRNLMYFEIDPSRFMVLTPAQIIKARGQRFTLIGVDNADMIPDMERLLAEIVPNMDVFTDRITITSRT